MNAADDDWRLQGQEATMADRVLTWATWTEPRPGWDHDHCEFCWAKFGRPELGEDVLPAGWVTEDQHWVCPTCFSDFSERFRWET